MSPEIIDKFLSDVVVVEYDVDVDLMLLLSALLGKKGQYGPPKDFFLPLL